MNRFSIVGGFYHKPDQSVWAEWFYNLWLTNLLNTSLPESIFIVSCHNSYPPREPLVQPIYLIGDLGHVDDLISGVKPYTFQGCTATWMIGAWLAYANETDFIYREQDVLWFGPMVKRLYDDIGERSVLFGKNQMHGAATSVILVKHAFIPIFVRDYIEGGPENRIERIAETKMLRLEGQYPEHYGRHEIPCDKDRPIPMDRDVFYCQKMTPIELREMESRGLISCEGMPSGIELFSNHK